MKKTLLTIACTTAISLASYAQTQLWGTTNSGGKYGAGTIFKTDSAGANHTVEHNFYKTPGTYPEYGKMAQAPNGKLYGATYQGGTYDAGVLFEYDPATGVYTAKYNFENNTNGNNGAYPEAQLLLANDGKLYGTTTSGGLTNDGTLFQYDYVTDTLINKANLNYINTGNYSLANLIQASNGVLYGVCGYGGLNGAGTLFSYNITTDTLIANVNFNYINGRQPFGELIQATDGNLYGQTRRGGVNNQGVLYCYNIALDTLIPKVDLDATTGTRPYGGLTQAYNGKLYATTNQGGTTGVGTLYEYDYVTDTLIVKVNFDYATTGSYPYGTLLQLSDSTLYGTTYMDGLYSGGTLFKYNPTTDTLITKFNFNTANGGAGYNYGSLMQATDGNLYGLSYAGGTVDNGSLFQYNLSADTAIVKVNLGEQLDGTYPEAGLLKATNGKLYGTTTDGGKYNNGVLFEYDMATKTYTKKVDFNSATTGYSVVGALMQASNGLLYGVTSYGSAYSNGTLFTYNIVTDTLIVKVPFNYTNGQQPKGAPVEATNGMLYGTTYSGGNFGGGVLYQYNPIADTLIVKHDFDYTKADGAAPSHTLIQAFDGKLYGTTINSWFHAGALFAYDITTDTLVIVNTLGTAGAYPEKGVIQGKDSLLYGTAPQGGANGQGTMYAYNLADSTFTVKINFDNTVGTNTSKLIQATNGNIYGLSRSGGTSYNGTLFQYNLSDSTVTLPINFGGGVLGAYPTGELIEVGNTLSTAAVNTINCGGSAIIVPYTAQAAFNANNVFTVQLSDALGSFTTPAVVGTLASSIASPIAVTLPNTAGIGYLIRVVSSSPALIGASNGVYITINANGTSTQTLNLCAGQSTTVGANTYTTSGTYVDVFTTTTGCDSTITTDLTVNPALNNTTSVAGDSITATQAGATYQWIDCVTNTIIPSAINQSYTATVTGSYAAVVTLNGCTDTSACVSIIITNTKAINAAAVISAYPNPNNGTFSITTATYGTYTIANELGQVVSTFTTNANATTAHIAGLASGIYVIKNTENGTIARTKIVVTQ